MRTSLRRRLPAAVAAVAVGIGAATVAVLAPGSDASAASGCQVAYRINQWSGGFVAYVDVTAGTSPVHGWTVTWTYSAGQQITSSWSAQVSQAGVAVTATSMSYNGELAAGGTTEFGVQGTSGASNPVPTDLAVTGSGCAGGTPSTPPSPSPTRTASPSPSTSPTRSPSPSPTPSRSPSASPTTSPPPTNPPGGCGSAVVCDGFENQAAGTPTGDWAVSYPSCSGAGTATIDTTTARSGGRSLRVNGAAGYCNHVFVGPTRSLTGIGPVWYARFYVRHTTALPPSHVAFAAMRDASDGGNDLRMGGQNAALQWNRQSDDATLPEQSPAGVALSMPLPVNQWTCVEFMVNGTAGTMQTWVNGTDVAGLHEDGTPTADVDRQWLSRANWHPQLTDFRLGWESYGDGADTLWFDDVALGATRIGC
ncbi:MAG TPA: cellulose-binding domain-containing protein [Rugosimonospora sp.]